MEPCATSMAPPSAVLRTVSPRRSNARGPNARIILQAIRDNALFVNLRIHGFQTQPNQKALNLFLFVAKMQREL